MNRLIISRKGFDGANGRVASPIFPDGTMFSLPIPDPNELQISYGDLRHGDVNVGDVVEDLTSGHISRDHGALLSPDINRSVYRPRHPEWRGLFVQVLSSQGTLRRAGVQPGDLFLFFGWFRRVECDIDHWRYVRGEPDIHVLWGWLSIGDIRKVYADIEDDDPILDWSLYFTAMSGSAHTSATLYIADDDLGAGVFPRFSEQLQLTNYGSTRSEWALPDWFYPFIPGHERRPLGYHGAPWRWRPKRDGVLLTTVGRGQEFVLDATAYPEAGDWALNLIDFFG